MKRLESYCRELRERCGCTDIPVDVLTVAEQLGIRIAYRSWRGRPHAISVAAAQLVILNRARTEQQQRFDLAHEIGEFILPCPVYHDRLPNQFAASLLMPEMEFVVELGIAETPNGLLSARFNVSQQAVSIRAQELGWLG